jgi:predicted nucleotidyltransferase
LMLPGRAGSGSSQKPPDSALLPVTEQAVLGLTGRAGQGHWVISPARRSRVAGGVRAVLYFAMRRDDALGKLRAHATAIRGYGVTALYLYGSTARDEAGERSDIDLFADVDYERFGFVPFMDLRDLLVDILGRPVDFTTRRALHPDLKDRIVLSAIKVFDDETVGQVAAE